MNIPTKPQTVMLIPEHRKQLEEYKKQGISYSFVMRKALDLYFATQKKEKK